MEFRIDFFFRVVMDIIYYSVQFAFFHIIYLQTDILAGWSIEQIRLFVCTFIIVDALMMTFIANGLWLFPQHINSGDLDTYLTRPVNSLFFLTLRDFAANSFLNLLLALGIGLFIFTTSSFDFTLSQLVVYPLMLIVATVLYSFLQLIFIIPVFWIQSPNGLGNLFYTMAHSMERPVQVYKGTTRFIFTFVLPFGMMTTYPASAVLSEDPWILLWLQLGVAFIFWVILQFFWKLGLRNYTSASS